LAAERGHCTLKLLAQLNPDVDLDKLKPGDELWLPNVARPRSLPRATAIEVDFGAKLVRILDTTGNAIGVLHCSIAAISANRPHGDCHIDTIVANPPYLFDPINWPEVENVDRRLVIPPGPRNPVGVCWIGLSITGYGIHGTPEPELIGKTGSHGCFRLTNWDVLRLAKTVRVGTAVRWIDSAANPAPEE
jgi:lipoprotein-anchoring transpeptidase ErfK/SrfK